MRISIDLFPKAKKVFECECLFSYPHSFALTLFMCPYFEPYLLPRALFYNYLKTLYDRGITASPPRCVSEDKTRSVMLF